MAFNASSLWIVLVISIHILRVAAQNYQISSYGVVGTGCAPGTVNTTLTDDKKRLSLRYTNFVAKAGPSYDYDDNRKNCQITFTVQVPSGYQFAFDKFTSTGRYAVDSKVQATHKTYYYFQSGLAQSQGSTTITGSASDDSVILTDVFKPAIWSPCGQATVVGINTALRVDNSDNANGSGTLALSDAVGTSFIWQTC
ncbi:hypothetical protein BDQ12DRAFT_738833 [Crucibulum laeve]|uniref:Secreted protein n=1 Tax=Crucibulum laeve TaxID=68775 RepID=A0A5C3LM37_9AGAR|nr:hypothetical protein BDQ12DRAFT_738833 [Crucibulum laeve]